MNALALDIPEFETGRLRFRAPSIDDYDDEVAFFGSDRSKGVGGPIPPEQVWRSMCGFLGHWVMRGYGFWAIEEKTSGRYCGRVGHWFPVGWPEPEIGWTMMGHAEGRGIAGEAARAARDYAYSDLGWTTAISLISHDNERSIALAERLGCTREPDYGHPTYGPVMIWRHPAPEAVQ